MNIINKLTLRHLIKNKRRTLVTIIGVVISVAMLTGVATLGVSFMSLLQQQEIATTGEWHALYRDVNEEQLASIHADEYTESIILSRDLGYAHLEGSENPFKPYLFFRAYNQTGFEKFPVNLLEGTLPTDEHEVLISSHIKTNGKVAYEIGDTITVEIGNRSLVNNDEYLDQFRPLRTDEGDDNVESLLNRQTKEYTIVGIMERPTWEPFSAPGYTVLTHFSEDYLANDELINVSVVWNEINRKALENAEALGEKLNIDTYSTNNSLLRFYGVINDGNLRSTFYSLVAIIMGVIVIGSISLIYNAFAISVSERSRHLGMLSSVGATKTQKRNSVFFEGFVIGLISIPLGIICGLLGIGATFHFINPLIENAFDMPGELAIVVTPMSLIVSASVSFLTIFISTYIPAKRASKISAIDAIRQTKDVKLTRKSIKTIGLVRRIFGIEAEIGLKNLKRNKRRYQVVVFSLVVSIVLFLTVSFFTEQLSRVTQYRQSNYNYDIELVSFIQDGSDHKFSDEFIDSITSLEEITEASFIHEVWLETTLTEAQVPEERKQTVEDNEYKYDVKLYILDDESLLSYTHEIGVDSDILMNENKPTGIIITKAIASGDQLGFGKTVEISPGESIELVYNEWLEDTDVGLGDIEVVALTDNLPMGVQTGYENEIRMIVSEETFNQLNSNNQINENRYALYLSSDEPLTTHEKIDKLKESNMSINNPHKVRQEEELNMLLISVFTYGFISLITAISLANILNTISTSISLRKQEFAMLKSVGMTPKGFNKMINYESIFYGIKALLYGLSISIGVMFLIYQSITESFDYQFELPWSSIFYVIAGVFVVVGSAMLYSGSKVKKENIIEGLKQENL